MPIRLLVVEICTFRTAHNYIPGDYMCSWGTMIQALNTPLFNYRGVLGLGLVVNPHSQRPLMLTLEYHVLGHWEIW